MTSVQAGTRQGGSATAWLLAWEKQLPGDPELWLCGKDTELHVLALESGAQPSPCQYLLA